MKRFIIVFCCISVLIMCLSISCFAAEEKEVAGTLTEDTNTAIEEDVEETHTIFTRLWEFCLKHKTEVLGVSGDGALIIIAVLMKLKSGKSKKEINASLNTIEETTNSSLTNQDNVVGAVNNLIDSFNVLATEYAGLKEAYERYGATELDRNKVIGALSAEVATVLDILSTVYVHNKNLPQGVKDLVTSKYANCLKTLEKDDELAAIVKAVRASVGSAESTEAGAAPEDAEA